MKIKLPIFLCVFLFVTLMATSLIYAAEFKLTSIGALDVSENIYSHMWYTGNQPAFSGTGTSGATVDIVIDANSYSTTVGTNDTWSWTPPQALESTDHTLSFVSGGQTISLTLTTGSDVPADTTTTTTTTSGLLQAGSLTITLMVLGLGGILISYPFFKKVSSISH